MADPLPPPLPPLPPGPGQPPRAHWAAIDQMPDDELMRFAPPEIRRLHRKLVAMEAGQQQMAAEIAQIRVLLERLLVEKEGKPTG